MNDNIDFTQPRKIHARLIYDSLRDVFELKWYNIDNERKKEACKFLQEKINEVK